MGSVRRCNAARHIRNPLHGVRSGLLIAETAAGAAAAEETKRKPAGTYTFEPKFTEVYKLYGTYFWRGPAQRQAYRDRPYLHLRYRPQDRYGHPRSHGRRS